MDRRCWLNRLTCTMETTANIKVELLEAYKAVDKIKRKSKALGIKWEEHFIESEVEQKIKKFLVDKMASRLSNECNSILNEYEVHASIKYTPSYDGTGLILLGDLDNADTMIDKYEMSDVVPVKADIESNGKVEHVTGRGERLVTNIDTNMERAAIHSVRNTTESLTAMLWVMISSSKARSFDEIRHELNKLKIDAWGTDGDVEYIYDCVEAVGKKKITSMGVDASTLLSGMFSVRISRLMWGE